MKSNSKKGFSYVWSAYRKGKIVDFFGLVVNSYHKETYELTELIITEESVDFKEEKKIKKIIVEMLILKPLPFKYKKFYLPSEDELDEILFPVGVYNG